MSAGRRALDGAALISTALAVLALVLAVNEARKRPETAPELLPVQWQLGGPQPERLAEWLGRVDRRVPYQSTLLLEAPRRSRDDLLALLSWTSYYLPRQRVLLASERPGSGRPLYLLMIGAGVEDHPEARGELLELDSVGALVRIPASAADPDALLSLGTAEVSR